MSICCRKFTHNIFIYSGILDKEERPLTAQELNKRLNNEARIWVESDRREIWGKLAHYSSGEITKPLYESLKFFKHERRKPGLAIEFGCGNSNLVCELLKKGWKVEAVDNCEQSLIILADRVYDIEREKMHNLTLVCTDMETYVFPKDVRFIIANHSLPYCNPKKIITVWDRAYESLELGGRIAGNFHPPPCNTQEEVTGRTVLGAWYTDKAVVQALLDKKGYNVESCEYSAPRYRDLFFQEPRQINFIGQKV